MTNDETDLLSAAEAAALLGVERSTIARYEHAGKLIPVRIDYEGQRRRPRFRRVDVEALRRPVAPSDT